MPKAYPKEFRDDVVRVAENREPGVTIERIAAVQQTHTPAHVFGLLRRARQQADRPVRTSPRS
ncbi:hypothetical protein [Microbacterium sp. SORGH_AS_0421]|uniref:hypothetical protein n=1 Tax=Microbacterium sp. SORGH_AS_0421 TaxID=3041768 RepID=UPI001AEAD603|nr:hypothetical protein [Microbacterium sp. SORGH_AS_0421]MDQ1176328.1 hypothetical protein [Microbacterium sp. SORGH_AS_0421]